MPEQLTLTTPIVPPTRTAYTFVRVILDLEAQTILASVRGSDGIEVRGLWEGAVAVSLMTTLNTANLTTTSLVKRVLLKMQQDGFLPAGAIGGSPS